MEESGLLATGERTAPGLPDEEYWFARHEVAYRWIAQRIAQRHAPGAVIVDAGAGEGYGAAMLTGTVVALEYDGAACAHMRRAYPQIAVTRANLAALPLRTRSVNALVSLQVVEHLWDVRGFLRECLRVLRPQGELVITTPQRLTFSPGLGRGEKPINPFHVEEFDGEQLRDLLVEAGFDDVQMRGVQHGSRLRQWEAAHGSIVAAQVAAALSGHWSAGLREQVRSVTTEDFTVDAEAVPAAGAHIAAAQDLVATARCAS